MGEFKKVDKREKPVQNTSFHKVEKESIFERTVMNTINKYIDANYVPNTLDNDIGYLSSKELKVVIGKHISECNQYRIKLLFELKDKPKLMFSNIINTNLDKYL